ncbi:MAG: DUF4301 family protein [Bacteroidales bacterium]
MEELTNKDIEQIHQKGLTEKDIDRQIENFIQGFPFIPLVKAAIPNEGIVCFDQDYVDQYKKIYGEAVTENGIRKFVPASGAASRMFHFLFEYLEDETSNAEEVERFISNIEYFGFYEDLKESLARKNHDIEHLIWRRGYVTILQELLEPQGLNYGNFPKALIKFHHYQNHSRTPVEEHMVEGTNYSINADGTVRIHYTILPEHKEKFESHIIAKEPEYENFFRVKFQTDYSFQDETTDRVAVDMNNRPMRNQDGSLLFRPGGHGALLNNLNRLNDDVIFIKNIDNVAPDKYKVVSYDYKKALAGILLDYQGKIFHYLKELVNKQNLSGKKLQEILGFLNNGLHVIPPDSLDVSDKRDLAEYLYKKLNRPLRVCGMVKNQGEPGGGPFWAENSDGSVSLQIVEKTQIDLNDPHQKSILDNSTHFNPVDIVCGVKDYRGRKFDLFKFRDPSAGIITHKSKEGKTLKVQELPGLWNGGMADWNTVFVEVPLITFTPVKTINDLLRDEHQ